MGGLLCNTKSKNLKYIMNTESNHKFMKVNNRNGYLFSWLLYLFIIL